MDELNIKDCVTFFVDAGYIAQNLKVIKKSSRFS